MDNLPLETETGDERGIRLKKIYYDFLEDFREYLVEFVKESSIDLTISSVEVDTTPQKLFQGECGGMFVTLKNQGKNSCYLTTDKRGAFELSPGDKEKIWLNKEVTIVTQSGKTILGFIRS